MTLYFNRLYFPASPKYARQIDGKVKGTQIKGYHGRGYSATIFKLDNGKIVGSINGRFVREFSEHEISNELHYSWMEKFIDNCRRGVYPYMPSMKNGATTVSIVDPALEITNS